MSKISYLSNIKRNLEQIDDVIDFISDDQIISTYGNKIAQNSDIRSFTKGTISQIRKHFTSSKEFRAFPQRFTRLFNCLENAEGWDETRVELLDSFISTEKGSRLLKASLKKIGKLSLRKKRELNT